MDPAPRPASPADHLSPTPAIGACPELSRCVSTASESTSRESFGSNSDVSSRQSSGSYNHQNPRPRLSMQGPDGPARHSRRRGYMRPQATDFAISAKSRESVMNLGSIAHLQYYFARTGLLDGKGGQLARKKKGEQGTLDLSSLMASTTAGLALDADASFAMADSDAHGFSNDDGEHQLYDGDCDESFGEVDADMLPPTVSTYKQSEKTVPKPPTTQELKAELEQTLKDASKALKEVQERKAGTYIEPPDAPRYANMPEEKTQSWYELQGMHILDVATLAIRAAKIYYTAHELPDRLDSIKPEKHVRADLLAVMEVLKQMATRSFKGGMKDEEIKTMDGWVDSVVDMLRREQEMESAEEAERAGWTWLRGDWTGREAEREHAFLSSMDPDGEALPPYTPSTDAEPATPLLRSLQNGIRLIQLHNAVLRKSRRRDGAIPTFHTDTQKPYRCADNLRYWVKAAELRFEVVLAVDALAVACDNGGPAVWKRFEEAVLKWARCVREELAGDCRYGES